MNRINNHGVLTHKYRRIKYPEGSEFRYIIINGEIFINDDANESPRFLARVLPWVKRNDMKKEK